MASTSFSLQVKLGYGCDNSAPESLDKACHVAAPSGALGNLASAFFGSSATKDEEKRIFVASASNVELSVSRRRQSTTLLAILTPPYLIDECLEKYTSTTKNHASGSCFWISDSAAASMSQDLLTRIHWSLQSSTIRGVIRTSIAAEDNAPAEIVLAQVQSKDLDVESILRITNGQALGADSSSILKILPVSDVHFHLPPASTSLKLPPASSQLVPQPPVIPSCAVCLHRIDPGRIGLPPPENEQLCSKFCPPPNLMRWASDAEQNCPKQRFLKPWSGGARCQACNVIQQYWHHTNEETAASLYCLRCSMHKTLWVCLTCGFVGCGRYSNRHSVQHFQETQHPYSLELATLRIWDYVHEDRFAHRVDLLECPSCPTLTHPWISRDYHNHRTSSSSVAAAASSVAVAPSSQPEKTPKKTTMVGEEYEALLQSALEEQALHYEGEIARLRAELSESVVDQSTLTYTERNEVDELKSDIDQLSIEMEAITRELLALQAQEAAQRATSQRLLEEQQEANALIKKIQSETHQEAQRGRMQMDDLEQQIQDLTTNLRMRQQFSENQELNEAQIFGTHESSTPGRDSSGRRGKKKGRLKRN